MQGCDNSFLKYTEEHKCPAKCPANFGIEKRTCPGRIVFTMIVGGDNFMVGGHTSPPLLPPGSHPLCQEVKIGLAPRWAHLWSYFHRHIAQHVFTGQSYDSCEEEEGHFRPFYIYPCTSCTLHVFFALLFYSYCI